MALQPRVNWMAGIVAEFFEIQDSYVVQDEFRKHIAITNAFLKGEGPGRIFVYYQTPYRIIDGEIIDMPNARPQLLISTGENQKLKEKAIYFVRTTAPGKPVAAGVANDDSVLFGQISEHSIKTLETLVNAIYAPMVNKLQDSEWGQCQGEQKKEFLTGIKKFSKDLSEAINSLTSGIQLRKLEREQEKEIRNPTRQPKEQFITAMERLFNGWIQQISAFLEKADNQKVGGHDPGPSTELDFWRKRMQKLTSVLEEMRSKDCRIVYQYLQQISKNTTELNKPKDKIYLATQKWKNLEIKVTQDLNEAKDNVKYLTTLQKFIEPLYTGTPQTIIDTLPALMNSIKMIHTIARYYNTSERMTNLFIKITNQMITNCKSSITLGKNVDKLWDSEQFPPEKLIPVLESCVLLHNAYQEQYNITKEKLRTMPKGKQFDFSQNQIFGKFDLFRRRVNKLSDLFTTVQQFKTLSKHNLQGMEHLLTKFNDLVKNFRQKKHNLLEYTNNMFDRDFVEFNVDVSTLESELQQFINKNFDVIQSIEHSLKLLRKFQNILKRQNLRQDLNTKYTIIFHNYGLEMHQIQDQYQKYRQNPPIVRNLPPVAGKITWVRHLFHRIAGPMQSFPQDLIKRKESKKFVKMYNQLGYTLFGFEYLYRQEWGNQVEKAKAGLQATLIIRHPDNTKLYVNFDTQIMELIREAKCLSRIGIEIPESAKIVLLQEEKFKMYYNQLQFVIKEYERILNKMRPNTKSLLIPHLEDLQCKLRPGMVTLTWTSMNIDGYLHHVHQGLSKFEQLIININDIMQNRIENNLKTLSKVVLVELPQGNKTFTLQDFVALQEEFIRNKAEFLKCKNIQVEGAVDDLLNTIVNYPRDPQVQPISQQQIQKLSKYYNWSMYQALLHATKYSLNAMKDRVCGRRTGASGKQTNLKPFFEVDVQLEGDQCRLNPSLDFIQNRINRAASAILKSTKDVQNWNQKDVPEDEKEPFYDWIAKDKQIVKVILLLTGSIEGTKNLVTSFLERYITYEWLWNKSVSTELRKFNSKTPKPTLEEYEEELKQYSAMEAEIDKIQQMHQIGAMALKTKSIKQSLKDWIEEWKVAYSQDLHKKARANLETLTDDIKQIQIKLSREVRDLDSLGFVMNTLEEIRKQESEIELQFKPVSEMYELLDIYLPNVMDKDQMDSRSVLENNWKKLVQQAETIRNQLQEKQAKFKRDLILGVRYLIIDVKEFRKDFEQNGPMVTGISPKEALDRLKRFSQEYQVRKRKYDINHAGQMLFGLPHQSYPELDKTNKEVELLSRLYNLYSQVIETINSWQEIMWSELPNEIDKMTQQIEQFGNECTRLPKQLKGWAAYQELKQKIDDFTQVLPLVQELCKASVRPRHWDQLIEITGIELPYRTPENFPLSELLKAELLKYIEDVEDIGDAADKQLKIQTELHQDIQKTWDQAEFELKTWKGRDFPCVLSGIRVQEVQEKLEEHMMKLTQFNAMRHVTPFKSEVQDKLFLYSEVSDIIDKWVKVQILWTSLESVFTSGDIAKSMPAEAKKFKQIDKNWLTIMERVNENKNVILSCTNDMLKNFLGQLQEGLQFCQKKLENYLEAKRNKFPRFYFVSNPVLLKILSQGSDPNAVQDDFSKLFDAISRVQFDTADRRSIIAIMATMGLDQEVIQLSQPVKAQGPIEEWLSCVEREMQNSMRDVCRDGARDCHVSGDALVAFIENYCAQVALLGIQMIWTSKVQAALEKSQRERLSALDSTKRDVIDIMNKLTLLCLTDITSQIKRVKVETLVTIHVHQRDLYMKIYDDAKGHRLKDANDFDWTKNTRIYWSTEKDSVSIHITDVEFDYCYEYLGAKQRLCITPLTDRCYITLAQALGMIYGGAPAGPAGTGKTETVKDMGRTLGIYVVVTNCSDQHRYRDMARIFKGLCQSGLWGCFDQFNRIALEVLSVVAMQIEAIQSAKKQGLKTFNFPGETIPILLIPTTAYFITMNPGYQGRQELPENLKVLFRGVAMMVPDRDIIIKVKLASVGFSEIDVLAKKFNILYRLCEEQLSKQKHYDFGLRNILSVLRSAGNIKRNEMNKPEQMLLCRTLRDMNLSKLVADDKPLFEYLLKDIFPLQKDIPNMAYPEIEKKLSELAKKYCLIDKRTWKIKIIQLYEQSMVRHGFMLVGPAGSGKSTIMGQLTEALTEVKIQHKIVRMNPKAITAMEMYGVMNDLSGEWTQGVFSALWAKYNSRSLKFNTWITCDGPVDAIWIENLNTVLDDNRILTLANNDRIAMTENVKLVFEVENLDNASPATVSRCGIVYVSDTDLYWEPLIDSWLIKRSESRINANTDEKAIVQGLVKKYISDPDLFLHMLKNWFSVIELSNVIRITNFLQLFTALLDPHVSNGENVSSDLYEKYFLYTMIWSIGGVYEQEEREKFHKFLESLKAPLPKISSQKMAVDHQTAFEYYVDPATCDWKLWEPEKWAPPKRLFFSQLLIPTMDSTRAEFIIQKVAGLPRSNFCSKSVLLVGGPGTAKTSVVLMYSKKFSSNMLFKQINFSSATSPKMFQDAIEGEVERRTGKTYAPPHNKSMTVFLDDMSMPVVNEWKDQITLEIVRQLIESEGFYFLTRDQRGDFKSIEGLQYVGAMNHPGGGRNSIPNRLKRHFFTFNCTPPSQRSVENIYGAILKALFNPKKYGEVINVINALTDSTIAVWNVIKKTLLPTPAKFHYVFNMRELSRVFQGCVRTVENPKFKVIHNSVNKMKSDLFVVGLWRHECLRVFQDKLVNQKDKQTFSDILDKWTIEKFKDMIHTPNEQDLLVNLQFSNFLQKDIYDEYGDFVESAPKVYEAIPNQNVIRQIVNQKLQLYNQKYPAKKMPLVMFDDAINHLLRLSRVIEMPRGNILLVGVGGSGKQSLTKLSAYIGMHDFCQISLTKTYNVSSLLDDLKIYYHKAGPEGKSVAFILTDAQIKTESFLEYINSLLSTGEVAGLIPKEEKDVISVEMKNVYTKQVEAKGEDPSMAELYTYFINRVRDHLHLVLAFSPVGQKFRERARKFPALFAACTIDWFLPWPQEALISVSTAILGTFKIDTKADTKLQLQRHMGMVHKMVTQVCGEYFTRMRRHVYVTPKSYLSFIDQYKSVYQDKYQDLNHEESSIRIGLQKLKDAADDIAKLSEELKVEEQRLKIATEKTETLLKNLEVENAKAMKKKAEVQIVQAACQEQRSTISAQRQEANRDLQAAIPYLKKAESAIQSIKPSDITEMKANKNPVAIVRMVIDAVNIIFMSPVINVKEKEMVARGQKFNFIEDSFEQFGKQTLYDTNFLKRIFTFSNQQKDDINDETCELLEPYFNCKFSNDPNADPVKNQVFSPAIARGASKALEGLAVWAQAMYDYHNQSKIVTPKMNLLIIKTQKLNIAEAQLAEANEELRLVEELVAELQQQVDTQKAEKKQLQENALKTKRKMEQATRLINSLAGERSRWTQDANNFADKKRRLVGDVAKSCAFVSYCGPFNAQFRNILLNEYFQNDLDSKNIPSTLDFELTQFLVDEGTVGEWNLQGLPSDDLSIQNGIMVTRSSRFPLLIDPQGQAISWILRREPDLMGKNCVFTLNNPNLKDLLKFPLGQGLPMLIENIENEVDPMLDPILEKQISVRGRNKFIKVSDAQCEYSDKFRLYMTSRLANPHFSPELAAKATIIDFTVTQDGLEQQLLGRVISKQQKSLEQQLSQLLEDVTNNMKNLKTLDKQLLDRLSSSQVSLLEDAELIEVLANIKTKAKEVNLKLLDAKEKKIEISEKREQYRPVAARGSVLYFCVVEMSFVSWMYNTSLQQFLQLFDNSIENAPKASLVGQRVENIIATLTFRVFQYISRGLFEKDKTTFLLMISLKILIKAGILKFPDISLLLKAGAGQDDRTKQFNWMDQKVWQNLKALTKHKYADDVTCFFRDLADRIMRNQSDWKKWIDCDEPQLTPVPDYKDRILAEKDVGPFIHLTLIRSLREDRTLLASNLFIRDVLGQKFIDPLAYPIEQIWQESNPRTPVLFLLSAGADPTGSIDELARKKKKFPTDKVSMGEEQDKIALEKIKAGFLSGSWVVLQNCHLGLDFMAKMEDILNPKQGEIDADFRLWLTCEPHENFPLGLLQMAIKVTNEPPKGLKAGLHRTFHSIINQDFLQKVQPYDKWRSLLFATCFLHSVVQERRKFGALGFCIPYEFNNSDLEASLTFLERHLTYCATVGTPLSWKAIIYMICEVQYGGRITDDLDRELFRKYGDMWYSEHMFAPEFPFSSIKVADFKYQIPDTLDIMKMRDYISHMPANDHPNVFGLHANGDLTFRQKESTEMINTLIDTQPKDAGSSGGGKSKQQIVKEKLERELIPILPPDFIEAEYKEAISKMRGPKGLSGIGRQIPLNSFLFQEIQRIQVVLSLVRTTMHEMVEAIDGTMVMTPELVDMITSIFDFRVPIKWIQDAAGVEISWLLPTLSSWIKGLVNRQFQLFNWLKNERLPSYWLTGFFNPQGFLTAMKQEVTRQNPKWSLDDVEITTEPLKDTVTNDDGRLENKNINPPQFGVLIHGLFLEGAGWNRNEKRLEEAPPKELFVRFPIMHVNAMSTAVTSNQAGKAPKEDKFMDKNHYYCPVYKYPRRTDKYLIFRVYLKCDTQSQQAHSASHGASLHWTLRGVALLCSRE